MSDPASSPKIIVTGATSIVGHYLLPRLLRAGYEVHAISRGGGKTLAPTGKQLRWHQADITHPDQLPKVDAQALIHLAPLWLLPALLPVLNTLQIKRVIGFGSTSLFSKADSADPNERQLAVHFSQAEEAISRLCGATGTRWTIFRPTLVYDHARDKNITRISGFIRRYGFFPLLGKGLGLRQPVHADDLAEACLMALEQQATFGKSYNLSGGETLTYRQMVETIFNTLQKTPHFLILPTWMFRGALRIMTLLPGKRSVTPEMATRMNVDLCFNHADATHDFGFSPRRFLPGPGDLRE